MTTLINVLVYWICAHIIELSVMGSTIVAWVVAVLFAYVTNRKWVFHSIAITFFDIIKEIFSFFVCRIVTGIVDGGCMLLFVEMLDWNDVIVKFVANVLVIILNYVASKFIIFKRKIYDGKSETNK